MTTTLGPEKLAIVRENMARLNAGAEACRDTRIETDTMKRRKLVAWMFNGVLLLIVLVMAFRTTGRPAPLVADTASSPVKVTGLWLIRSAEPSTDITVLSLVEPTIGDDGSISLPPGSMPTRRYEDYIMDRERGNISLYVPADMNFGIGNELAYLFAGRRLERGERAYVHSPQVTFYPPSPATKRS
jgi:hypothetical protein